jgi:prepilin-type N-terminal cleavage/methylation domain-containing protein
MQRSFQPNFEARRNAFTLIELLVVLAIIGVLASLIVGLAGLAGRKSKEAQVRAQLNGLITAIDRYKSEFGYYPPDNVLSSTVVATNVNPAINQLYYELTGVIVNNQNLTFQSVNRPAPISVATVQRVFRRDGFVHAATDAKELKFLGSNWKANQVQTVMIGNDEVDLLVVPTPFPKGHRAAVFKGSQFETVNPWRYVSTNPTNNPASFDLWAEVPINSTEVRIIGNWKE